MSRRGVGHFLTFSLFFPFSPPSSRSLLLSHSTPVDRRIKEDTPVDSPGFKAPSTSPAKRLPSSGGCGEGRGGRKKGGRERERRQRDRAELRVFGEDTPPVYTANVGSNSSWLVATKYIPDSPGGHDVSLSFAMLGSITRARW